MDGDFTVLSLELLPADSELELQGVLSVTGGMYWDNQHIRGGTILLKTGSHSVWAGGILLSNGVGPGELEVEPGADLTIEVDLQSGVRMIESEIRNRGVIDFDASDTNPNIMFYAFSMTDAQIWNAPGASLNFDGINNAVLNLTGAGASGVFNSFGTVTVDDRLTVDLNALFQSAGHIAVLENAVLHLRGGATLDGTAAVGLNAELGIFAELAEDHVVINTLTVSGLGHLGLFSSGPDLLSIQYDLNLNLNATLSGYLDGSGNGAVVTVAADCQFLVVGDVSGILNGLTIDVRPNATFVVNCDEFYIMSDAGIVNWGTLVWLSGNIHAGFTAANLDGVPIANKTGSTMEVKGDFSFVGIGGPTRMLNNGNLLKSGGVGNADFSDLLLSGNGTVTINAGCGTIETMLQTFEVGVTQL